MASEFILPIAVTILAGAGAFSAWVGWNKSGEPFDGRKFANGLVTGILAGIGLTIANAAGITASLDNTTAFVLIGSLALSVIGIDNLRTAVSASIANRAEENVIEAVEETVAEEENKSTPI